MLVHKLKKLILAPIIALIVSLVAELLVSEVNEIHVITQVENAVENHSIFEGAQHQPLSWLYHH